jgi:small-conductance mechanosensitive channel
MSKGFKCKSGRPVQRYLSIWARAGAKVSFSLVASICCVAVLLGLQAGAQSPAPSAGLSEPLENPGIAVEVDGRPIFSVYAQVGGITPEERAEAISERIILLSKNKSISVEAIHPEERGTWTEIVAGNERLLAITEADARAAEKRRPELATEYTEILRQVVRRYREEHTLSHLLRGTVYAAVTVLLLTGALTLLFWIRRRLRRRLYSRLGHPSTKLPADALKAKMKAYLGRPFLFFVRIVFWLVVVALVQVCITVVMRFFPATRYSSYQITGWVFSGLAAFGKAVVGYIPHLILLMCIIVATSFLIRLNAYFFGEIREQRLAIHGFYPDWAAPTAKLVRALICAVAVVIAFPYLPGSESPAFKGISVFVGVLLSLGSSSAMAHAVAGTILTYMRAFQVGDFVRIGTDLGEVVEKTLLVTRIKTQKSEVITIPNGTVLGGVVVNYSAEGRKRGVIFHTVVTIGYTTPWRQVHELLMSAALATEGVLHDPGPFVLQTGLNDFYVSYELNAYTAIPGQMQTVYSRLHQNIQDRFNEARVEINSPHYTCLRNGNETTIPESYRPSTYRRMPFEVQHVEDTGPGASMPYRYEEHRRE